MFVLEIDSEEILEKLPKELVEKIRNTEDKNVKEIIKNFLKTECDCPECRAEREGQNKKENVMMSFGEFVSGLMKLEEGSKKTDIKGNEPVESTESEKANQDGPKEDKKFWLVWRPTGNAPRKKHSSRKQALEEAKRLAAESPNAKFYVLEATDELETTVQIKSNKL